MAQKIWMITGVSRGFGPEISKAALATAKNAFVEAETSKWRALAASTDYA
jgi:hypothetical protein